MLAYGILDDKKKQTDHVNLEFVRFIKVLKHFIDQIDWDTYPSI